MINVSFYLLTPGATSQSQVYVSISNRLGRLRFATGYSFLTTHCNLRKKKGGKELVKRGTSFYFEYKSQLNATLESLIRIEMGLANNGSYTLDQIRDAYYLQTGKSSSNALITFEMAFSSFVSNSTSQWTDGTKKHFFTLLNHLHEYEGIIGKIKLEDLNEDFWNDIRDNYFAKTKKLGNSTINTNLKKLKQFLKYALKKKLIPHEIDLDDLKYLEEIEPFKIALKEAEVESIMKINLSTNERLDKVRDLFALEILTGQRYSDMPKVLDPKHLSSTNIQIYQQKTGEKVTIPLHPKLKKHLAHIVSKYPEGLPTITNQKFNEYLKEICKKVGFDKEHSWITQSGKRKISHTDFRYNLVSSHTGRRTFCTLALKSGINSELIMKVTGHKKYDQFRAYIRVDDEDLDNAFDGMFSDNDKK